MQSGSRSHPDRIQADRKSHPKRERRGVMAGLIAMGIAYLIVKAASSGKNAPK